MAKLTYRGTLKAAGGQVMDVGLSVLAYEDEGLRVVFSPARDLFGYGHTDEEARHSFDETLQEFLRYTTQKGTLQAELMRLGWKTAGRQSHRTFKAPALSNLLRRSEQLQEIVNSKEFRKYDRQLELPVLAPA